MKVNMSNMKKMCNITYPTIEKCFEKIFMQNQVVVFLNALNVVLRYNCLFLS